MNIPGIDKKYCELVTNTLKQFPEIESAILFGSRAIGSYKNGSDIDIAIKGKAITNGICVKVSGILNEELPLPWKFDVIHFDSIQHSSLIDHINRVGTLIYG
ncbi:nucleotidyltransferase domain-containing protein [Natronoflexus pectinivorans]|uniref:Nucleotidyltransferase-like protein n=1 Tax=Natronoflexus pectinivorans TaxID=682526 RepID=A0A4R2GI02_9BACT|nr:nucleotidyltransferase domain-containing protein [Natronoflexus pectinivorans]TCO06909.1 nucleotidyltransferase-like protein [Natronoflexus pectinivorans]